MAGFGNGVYLLTKMQNSKAILENAFHLPKSKELR